jgi:NDP-sugar pyrophosphorylase family protein
MKPVLIILAAGCSSRFGSWKQVEPLGPKGETLIDYTLYDAIKAGFQKVVLVTNQEIAQMMKRKFNGDHLKEKITVEITVQDLPKKRSKPWGTAHAVLSTCASINQPFAVVNGDDFYGFDSLATIALFLSANPPDSFEACLVGYRLGNTLSRHGENARGLCEVNRNGYLSKIVEQTHIVQQPQSIFYRDEQKHLHSLSPATIVSMNCWGFPLSFCALLRPLFTHFITKHRDDAGAEFFLPEAVNELVAEKKVRVKVFVTENKWFGITFKEDLPQVKNSIKRLINKGIYPANLW